MAALDFSDLIPAQPQQPAPAAAVQAPPPVSPQVVGQGAVFTDTGQSGTPGQVATYGTLARTGGYDPSQAPGSIRNPFGLRPGASIPAGAWYVDQNGGVQQAGQGGVSVPAAALSSQPSMSAATAGGAPSPGQALNFDDLVPKPAWQSDALNSIPAGLEHAATGVLGFVGNIGDLTDAGVQSAANGVRGLFGAAPIHLQHANPPGFNYPDSAELNRDIESVTGPVYQPQTWAGRAVDTGLSFAPAAVLGPEGAGAKILSTAVPAATSFGAGETARAFGHPEWAGPAQLVGGLTGGLGVAAAGAAPLSTKVLANATQGLSESDIAAAQALQTRAAAMGVPLTLPEAVAQTGSKGAPLLLAQRAVENSQGGGRVLAPFMAARPQAMRAAVGPVLDQIAPATDKPSAIGVQAQGVAQNALDRTRQAVNAPASPMYAAAQSDLIAPSDYAGLAANPSYQIALKAVRSNPELGPAIAGQPDNSAGVVNEVVKELDRSSNAARITEMNPSGNNQLAAVRNQAAALANRVAGASSANYAGARSTVAQGMEGQYTPLQAGPTGAIAGTDQLGAQTRALYPARPYEGSAAETMAAVKAMNAAQAAAPGGSATDPLVTAMLTRQHLANAASEAMQTTARGDNPYGGAAFAANVSGNPLQANALNAGVTASAGPDAASQLADLLNVYGATGKRLPTSMATPEELGAFTRSPHTSATELGVGLAVASEAAHNPMAALLGIPLKAATRGLDVLGKARAQNEAERLATAITGAPDDALQTITDAQRRAAFSRQALASAIGGTALSGAQQL